MAKDFAVLINIDKWLKSTAGMDVDIRGWYFTLLLHQYDKGGLPSNIEDVALLAGVKFSEYKRFEQVFEQVFKQKFICSDDGLLRNPVMDQVLIERNNYKVKREIAGKISYILRYFRKKEGYCAEMDEILKPLVKEDTDTKSEHMLEHLFKICSEHLRNRNRYINIDNSSNTDESKPMKPKKSKAEKAVFFQDSPVAKLEDFKKACPEDWGDTAKEFWYHKARDYSLSKGAKYVDWIAAVRNWARSNNHQQNQKPKQEPTPKVVYPYYKKLNP